MRRLFRTGAIVLFTCGLACAVEAGAPPPPITFERFASLLDAASAEGKATQADAATLLQDAYRNPAPFQGYATRIIFDPRRPIEERVMAGFILSGLPGEDLFAFLDAVVSGSGNGALGMGADRQGYSVLEAALILSSGRSVAHRYPDDPRTKDLLARARAIPGLDPRLAWAIDAARGAPKAILSDAQFGALMESIVRVVQQADLHHLQTVAAFRDIYEDPLPYRAAALHAVLDPALSIDARVVACLIIQRLPTDDLYAILETITQAAQDGRLGAGTSNVFKTTILDAALFPHRYGRPALRLYGNDPRAAALGAKVKAIVDTRPKGTADQRLATDLGVAAKSAALLAGGPSYADYVATLNPVAERLAGADWYDGVLFGDEGFLAVLENPQPYRRLAEQAMFDPAVEIETRILAAVSMQGLPQDELFDLLDTVVDGAAAGRLDMTRGKTYPDTILGGALFPRVNFNAYLSLVPDDPRSRRLLAKAAAIRTLPPSLRTQIEEARSGQAHARELESYGGVEPFPRLDYVREGREVAVPDLATR